MKKLKKTQIIPSEIEVLNQVYTDFIKKINNLERERDNKILSIRKKAELKMIEKTRRGLK